jgi:DNA-binding Lrp family transcriptional regulator
MESIPTKEFLSKVDRDLLKILLNPDGKQTSILLAKKLRIPHTTVQRRRKRLERQFLQLSYSLNLEQFGWHRVDLLIATKYGKTSSVAKQLLSYDEVTYVGKSIGEHTIDVLEKVKGLEGVEDTVWSEIVEVVGKKRSIPSSIIDQL